MNLQRYFDMQLIAGSDEMTKSTYCGAHLQRIAFKTGE
jgi:hypothetical protein